MYMQPVWTRVDKNQVQLSLNPVPSVSVQMTAIIARIHKSVKDDDVSLVARCFCHDVAVQEAHSMSLDRFVRSLCQQNFNLPFALTQSAFRHF